MHAGECEVVGFEALFTGEFEPMSADLHALAMRYHLLTEAYDRVVCTGTIRHGGVMPATCRERGLINSNAREVMRRLTIEAAPLGFDTHSFRKDPTSPKRRRRE